MCTVSIVIVTYNSASFISACLSSIVEYTKDVLYEIVVVDNHSEDRTIEIIEKIFPEVTLLKNKENRGFAAANNQGAKEANGEYLFFLNPDTELRSDAISEFLGVGRPRQAGAEQASGKNVTFGCNLINDQGEPVFCGGNFPSIKQQIFDLGFNKLFPKYYKKHLSLAKTVADFEQAPASLQRHSGVTPASPIDYICGAAMFISKQDFERANGFDEGFFLYYEEVDLCKRLAGSKKPRVKPGVTRSIIQDIKIVHHESASVLSMESFNYKKFELLERSKYYYFKKHYGILAMYFVKFLQLISLVLHTPFSQQSFIKSVRITCGR